MNALKVINNFIEKSSTNKKANYPDHPDDIVISKKNSLSGKEYHELDIWNYYTNGVVTEMLKELKDRNLFIGIRLRNQTGKPLYIRHLYDKKTEYIRINNSKDFEKFHSGRMVEIHVTMSAICPYYVIDFDAGDEPFSKTKKITADIADELDKLSEVRSIEIRYTGQRGFHVLGWLKKGQDVDKAREYLKEWLKEHFGDRDDVVIGESPKGKKGALGLSPMKLNGGHIAKYSLRVTGLCCIEVPRAKLMSFEKTDATIDKVYKKLTGKNFKSKEAITRVINSFLESNIKDGWVMTFPERGRTYPRFQPSKTRSPNFPEEQEFAKPGEPVEVLEKGKWVKKPWSPSLEDEDTVIKVHEKGKWITKKEMVSTIINNFINEDAKIIHIISSYDHKELKPGYRGKFVISEHSAERAGDHWDVRLEFPVKSLLLSLKKYISKRPNTNEPTNDYLDKPGSVLRSFVTKKEKLPTKDTKIFLIESHDHPINYAGFEGEIKEGYGKGTVKIWDFGTYNLLDLEGDKKYIINFNGKEIKGTYALIKYKNGYLWVKMSEKEASIDI